RDFTDRDFMNLRTKGFTIRGDKTISLEEVTYEVPGIRVFYTGDTMYFEDLAKELGKVDVLIHDSTFLDEDQEARSKRHSTAREAISMAQRLDAELLVLTHISNKYEHVPDENILSRLDTVGRKVVIARDGMRVILKREESLKITII
ncbi:MAG: MBL fold metallo-hydrolase, partial [Candidatus Micrarchaeota archaeon]|nr:MBL fold metallo-hydrolase [Candidatus Micrarchaeota archaeon]